MKEILLITKLNMYNSFTENYIILNKTLIFMT